MSRDRRRLRDPARVASLAAIFPEPNALFVVERGCDKGGGCGCGCRIGGCQCGDTTPGRGLADTLAGEITTAEGRCAYHSSMAVADERFLGKQ